MPNWNYNRMTFKAHNEQGKEQLTNLIKNHIEFIKEFDSEACKSYVPTIKNETIIPYPPLFQKVREAEENYYKVAYATTEKHAVDPREDGLRAKMDAAKASAVREYGYGDSIDFCRNQWGSKWGFCECHLDDSEIDTIEKLLNSVEKDGEFVISATSPWCPPMGLIHKLNELYPDVDFHNEWGEEQVTEYYGIMDYTSEDGFSERTPKGMELWTLLYNLGFVAESPDDEPQVALTDDGVRWRSDEEAEAWEKEHASKS